MQSRILIALLACSACEGSIVSTNGSPGGGSASPDGGTAPTGDGGTAANAEPEFTANVLPLITTNCMSCHSGTDGNGWMKPNPDVYTAVMAWPSLVVPASPTQSLMITKGQHEGPAWQAADSATILTWIQDEGTARAGSTTTTKTNAITVTSGDNTIALDSVGSVGSTITFTAQKLTLGLYLSNITVHAASPAGVHITHPLFVTWPDPNTPDPDPVDSFDRVDMDVAAGMTSPVGGGLLMLENVSPTATLSVIFKAIGPSTGGTTVALTGCKAVASFTTNAQPMLSANCVSCHGGGNASATAATDMTMVNTLNTAGQTAACGQILGRVDLTTPADSGVYVSPDPNSGASHPFKFSAQQFTTFQTALSTWITAEKAAGP